MYRRKRSVLVLGVLSLTTYRPHRSTDFNIFSTDFRQLSVLSPSFVNLQSSSEKSASYETFVLPQRTNSYAMTTRNYLDFNSQILPALVSVVNPTFFKALLCFFNCVQYKRISMFTRFFIGWVLRFWEWPYRRPVIYPGRNWKLCLTFVTSYNRTSKTSLTNPCSQVGRIWMFTKFSIRPTVWECIICKEFVWIILACKKYTRIIF